MERIIIMKIIQYKNENIYYTRNSGIVVEKM